MIAKTDDLTLRGSANDLTGDEVYRSQQGAAADMINNPPHYKDESGIECIEVTRYMQFCGGNCFKYLYRAGQKGDVIEDLEKARWYAERAWICDREVYDTTGEWLQNILAVAKQRQGNIRSAICSMVQHDWQDVEYYINAEIDRLKSEVDQ